MPVPIPLFPEAASSFIKEIRTHQGNGDSGLHPTTQAGVLNSAHRILLTRTYGRTYGCPNAGLAAANSDSRHTVLSRINVEDVALSQHHLFR
jgi:hypothetical protein